MSKKENKILGKGLSAILGNNLSQENKPAIHKDNSLEISQIGSLLISDIELNPFQPRQQFDQEKLNELSLSIKELGVIQPITVRRIERNKYQLISGERRYRASKLANILKIPAFIRVANDQQMLEMALVENIQRQNLNAIEISLSYQRLINECNLTQEACSLRVGKKRSTITNFLRLLKLPPIIQKGLKDRKITTGHARSLINIENKESQTNLYYDIIANGYSVREVEELSKTFKEKKYKRISRKTKSISIPFNQKKMIYDLSIQLNTDIDITQNKKGSGKLTISYENQNELERIFKLIQKQHN
tara:strand:- start:41912 stop:42823 length:912 start_codon:yes stop_codon:yes gene_type:complete